MTKQNNMPNMKKLTKLDNLSPELLYYPIDQRNNLELFVDGNSQLYKETPIYKMDGINYYSTVSGKALGTKKIGENNYLVVQNDFKEKYKVSKSLRKKVKNLSKKEILDLLKNNEYASYSDNIKYFINNFEKIDSLVLSLMVCEESQKVYSYVFEKHNIEIMEIFDDLSQIFEIQNPIIIISDTEDVNIEYITNLSGMFPNIRVVLSSDKYPSSHPLLISRKLNLTNSLVLTPVDLYYLYSIIKKDKKVLEKYVYVTGPMLEKNYFVNTKLNVLVSDILNRCKIKLSDDEVICKNSAIRGEVISKDDIIDPTVDALIIVKKEICDEKECINCGLCNKYCPQKLNPQFYKLSKKLFPGKWIDCNMCSYICPSKIGRKL